MHIANLHTIILALVVEFLTTRLCHQKAGQSFLIFFLLILIYTILHLIMTQMRVSKPPGTKLNIQLSILQYILFLTKNHTNEVITTNTLLIAPHYIYHLKNL